MSSQIKQLAVEALAIASTAIVDDDFPEVKHRFHGALTRFTELPELPKIVCLCGSTRFRDDFTKANYLETMAGNIVLSVGFFGHSLTDASGESTGCTANEKIALDVLHKRKIDLADEVLVLNVGGYIGDSTRSEIHYAILTKKSIRYLEEPPSLKGGY